jgi:hypothetical protein
MKPANISVTGGNQVNLSNSAQDAVTSSLVVQVNYAYNLHWSQTRPLFALLQTSNFSDANLVGVDLREVASACQAP